MTRPDVYPGDTVLPHRRAPRDDGPRLVVSVTERGDRWLALLNCGLLINAADLTVVLTGD